MLPTALDEMARSAVSPPPEVVESALAWLNDHIRLQLIGQRIPRRLTCRASERGYVVLRVDGEFEAKMTLADAQPSGAWRLLSLRMLVPPPAVAGVVAGTRNSEAIEEPQKAALCTRIQQRLDARTTQEPIVDLYDIARACVHDGHAARARLCACR